MTCSDTEQLASIHAAYQRITKSIGRVIVGQADVIDQLLITLLAGGHCILIGVPGLAKTRIVHALADCLELHFRRIQFTPDLMPSDITGTEVIQENKQTGERTLRFLQGPLFANVVLADEINRTPPKTQAALLEAMQERHVTVGGIRHPVSAPFFVLATENPIEQEGTYPLPEAQLDRFLLEIRIDYPDERDELEIVRRTTAEEHAELEAAVTADELKDMLRLVRHIPISEQVARVAVRMARSTRPDTPDASTLVAKYVAWGAGPRGSQSLVLAAKARAAIRGQPYVSRDDLRAVALPALRHRLQLNYAAQADGVTSEAIVDSLVHLCDSD